MQAATFFDFRRRTTLALSAIVFFAVFAFGATDPWAFPVVAGILLGASALWALRIVRHPYQVILNWFYLPLAVIPLAGAAQMALGKTVDPYRTAGELGWWIAYFVFFALLVNVLDDISLRRTVQRRLAYLGGATSALAIGQWILSPRAAYGFRLAPGAQIFGPFADAENFAFLVELLFPGALFLAFRDSERKASLFASCILMVAAITLSGSAIGLAIVAGELVLVLAVSTYLAARSMSRRVWAPQAALTILGAIAVTAVILVGLNTDGVRSRLGLGLDPIEAPGIFVLDRSDVYETSWRLFQQEPVLGHGLGAFGDLFSTAVLRRDGFHWEHGYTDPVELMVELGAVGIAVQAILLLMVVGRKRSARTWLSVILPLAAVWAHSWVRSPLRTPALVLVALSLLAMLRPGRERSGFSRSSPEPQES
jgi:O-antigen ligase